MNSRYRAAATSKMERFVIKVNGSKLLTVITKRSILDVVAALDPPLEIIFWKKKYFLLTIMPTNCSQLKHLEVQQVHNGKKILL